MIEVSIAYDEHFNALSEFAQLVFLKILPHTDDLGRFDGNPTVIKARVMPFSERKTEDIFNAICESIKVGILNAYIGQEKLVVYYNPESFKRINAVLVKNNLTGKSEYPEPDEKLTLEAYEGHVRSRASLSNRKYKAESIKYKVESKEIAKESFERFWEHYPRKVGKKAAQKAFDKINPDNEFLDKILSAVDAQIAIGMISKKDQFTKHPATWLNAGCWEDEIIKREQNGKQLSTGSYQSRLNYKPDLSNKDKRIAELKALGFD